MPSWNIHTAHVERLVADRDPRELGIEDVNAFLFGNYVPDIYVGFMVPNTTYRIDYCITHLARVNTIPLPMADQFWDDYIFRRRPQTPAGLSLTLGAWAHLVADRFYNGNFRLFCESHEAPSGEELRKRKQADFDLFGHALGISSHVEITPELEEAAQAFRAYSICAADVARSVDVADEIVRTASEVPAQAHYQLLGADWLGEVFGDCDKRLASWLEAWQDLEASGLPADAARIREIIGAPPVR